MATARDSSNRVLLFIFVLFFLLFLSFAIVAWVVLAGKTHLIDKALLLSLRNPNDTTDPLGPLWLEEMVRDFTALGSVGVLTFTVITVSLLLWLIGMRKNSTFVLLVCLAGTIIGQLLKMGFDRARPDVVPHVSVVYSTSFPSGHSMMAAVVWLTLAILLSQAMDRKRHRVVTFTLASLLIILIGLSRVYLGVHWPTDVLAGWLSGIAWVLVCVIVAIVLRGNQSTHH